MKPCNAHFKSASRAATILGILLTCLMQTPANAQAPGIVAKPVHRASLGGDETKEVVMLAVEFAPGATTGRHTHLGDEMTLVQQGTLELSGEGRETRRVTAGDVYHNPGGLVHEARNVGDGAARVTITFVLDKGKPVTLPTAIEQGWQFVTPKACARLFSCGKPCPVETWV